jgi:dTDP-4-dehydrorhamnose reductase
MSLARRTLVLGGSGFLGVHVVRAALARGGEVCMSSREPHAAPIEAEIWHARAMTLDLLRSGAIDDLLDGVQADRIVLCAALSRIDECDRYPVLARTLNVEVPERVASWTQSQNARLVFVSTDLVFGAAPPPAHGFREEDAVAPVSEYGRTKSQGEISVLREDPRALVVRLPLLYGESFGRGLGASDSVLAAVERGDMPKLFTDEWRTPLDVAVAARAVVELANATTSGILHVAGRERLSRHELGVRALCARGVTRAEALRLVRATTRAEAGHASRPADVSLDASRARAQGLVHDASGA